MNFFDINKKILLVAVLLLSCVFFSACTSLKKLDNAVGEVLFNDTPKNDLITDINEKTTSTPIRGEFLSKEQKERIDSWLELNGFNRYGDALGTIYASGTPLFDKISGEAIDRFDYILIKHRDILSNIN